MAASPRFRPTPPETGAQADRQLGPRHGARAAQGSTPPRVLPRQETRTGPILTDKHGMFPRRGESHVLPAAQKGPMMPRRPPCLNQRRSQQTLEAATPPFTPHTPVPVCSSLTPRHLRPSGVTENVFSVEGAESVLQLCSTLEPDGSARFSGPARVASQDAHSGAASPRGRGIGHDIDPWSASHSKPSWEPTAQVGVRINVERRADRFKTYYSVVPAMPNELVPRYYASSRMDDFDESTTDFYDHDSHRRESNDKTGQEWIEDAANPPVQIQFVRDRAGFNPPGSSDDEFRIARARQQFYQQLQQLGPCQSERGFAMVYTPRLPTPSTTSQRTSQIFKLSGGIRVASKEATAVAHAMADPSPKTSSDWRNFKQMLHSQRQPTVLGVPQDPPGDERILTQWPARESITFRSCVDRGLLVAGNEAANIDSSLPRYSIIARQARQH